MQENNYPELISQMETLGLGRDPSLHLLNSVYRGFPSINLHFRDTFGADQIDALLHFIKMESSNKYVFTHWDLEVRNTKEPSPLKQTFSVADNSDPITLMEAYNLLQGRSICKSLPMENGEKLSVWCALDFKNTDRNGNYALKVYGNQYDVVAMILRHPIKEMQTDWGRMGLIRALEEGRQVLATIQMEEREQKVYIEALPKFNSIKFYDLDNRPIVFSKALQRDHNEKTAVRQAENPSIRPSKIRL